MQNIYSESKLISIDAGREEQVCKSVQKECKNLSVWGYKLLYGNLKESVRTIVLEQNYICKDHKNLFSQFYSKKFSMPSPRTCRMHFFSDQIKNIHELLYYSEQYSEKYIGYSIIRQVSERCIGRTVINPYAITGGASRNSYYLLTEFAVHLHGAKFKVQGFPYTSQDVDVTVCAHSALWAICRYLSERYTLYSEVHPFDLVKMTGTSLGRTFPYRGMTYADYSQILSSFGVYPVIVSVKKHTHLTAADPEELKKVYTYIESGFPVLASFAGHVIALVGHTIDYDRPYIEDSDGFIDSFSFLKQFITIDDNFFPYALLGYEDDPDNYAKVYPAGGYSINSIVTAVCPLPEKAFLPAEKAKQKAMKYFRHFINELKKYSGRPWVTRFFITTNKSFKRGKLGNIRAGHDKLDSFILNIELPHFVWVMEISSLADYKKGVCVAEIVLDSTASEKDDAVLYMRIGNTLYFNGKEKNISGAHKSFPQYTDNLKKE